MLGTVGWAQDSQQSTGEETGDSVPAEAGAPRRLASDLIGTPVHSADG
jgi:hypothetical protein